MVVHGSYTLGILCLHKSIRQQSRRVGIGDFHFPSSPANALVSLALELGFIKTTYLRYHIPPD